MTKAPSLLSHVSRGISRRAPGTPCGKHRFRLDVVVGFRHHDETGMLCPEPRLRIECTLVAADQTRCGRGPVCVSVALPASRIWGGCVAALRDAGLPMLPGGATAPRPQTPDPRVGRASGADVVPRASGLPLAAPEREKAAKGLPGPLQEGNGCERQGAAQPGPEHSAAIQEELAP